ncbi:MAG TPA: DoxX family protein [Candidatus Peribacterales bacterium]|nr:DoxX family protein [Candidatus Peribacterales bacterium]
MTKLQESALIALRLIIGAIFIYAGYGKLMFWSAPPEGTPAGMVYLIQFLSIVEPLGGIALIAGFLTKWAAAGLAIIMVGAAVFVRVLMKTAFFTSQTGSGIDYIVLIFAGCLALIAYGGGKWTVDAMWKR